MDPPYGAPTKQWDSYVLPQTEGLCGEGGRPPGDRQPVEAPEEPTFLASRICKLNRWLFQARITE